MATRWTSKHTGQKIDDTIDGVCNPNLLDNWYFANPVNQRGQVKYTNSWAYGIDRWLCAGDGRVTIAEGHCVFYGAVDQGLSVEMPDILGCTMTASLLLTDGTLITGTAVNTDNSIDIPFVSGTSGVHLALNATDLSNHRRFRTYIAPERAVVAVKLELGSQQTLAHQDADGNWVLNEIPDYGEQLRRCQRYFQVLKSGHGAGLQVNGAKCYAPLSLPVPLRTNPTVSIVGSVGVWNGRIAPVTSIVVNQYAGGCEIILDVSTTDAATGTCIVPYANTENIKDNFVCLSADL